MRAGARRLERVMRFDPVHKVPGGYRFGLSGKVYKSRAAAEKQAAAIFASGWRDDAKARAGRRLAARHLSASRAAETRYVLELMRIMGEVHRGVLKVVATEYGLKQDEAVRPLGLGDRLLGQIFRYVGPQVQLAFGFMSTAVEKNNAKNSRLIGINPHHIAGVDSVIEHARAKNVALIRNASQTFLDQVRDVLEENDGARPEHVARLLGERVDVSKSRATLIARDQTTKLNASINEHRQRAAGVTKFKWSTSQDERVRASHAELEGQEFSWDDPPIVDDEPATPGQPVNCRCVAIPVIPELEEGEEEGSQSGAEEGEELLAAE